MTLDRMNYLYKKGLYSPINYYLGLLAILKDGAELGVVMGRVRRRCWKRSSSLRQDTGNHKTGRPPLKRPRLPATS